MKKYYATFDSFEILLPQDVVKNCYHSGPCDYDVENALLMKEVQKELSKIDPSKLKKELKEYGAWDEKELSNHDDNLKRILWIAAGNIQESEEWKEG